MKKGIYFTTIAAIAILGAGLVTAKNTTNFLAQSTEKVSVNTEMIEGLTVIRTEGSIIAPKDIEDLIAKSDIIAIGKPTQSITESTPLIQRDFGGYTEAISQTEFKVQRVLKGASYSDTLLIGQQAAIVADRITGKSFLQVFDDYQPLVKNAKYLLFLKKGLAHGSGLYFTVGLYYGKFNIDGTDQAENKIENSHFKLIRKDVIERFKEIIDETSAS